MHTVLYIGLGAGLAGSAGMRPFAPALLAGAFASAGWLGVTFGANGGYTFLCSGGWLVAMAVLLLASYLLLWRIGSDRLEASPVAAAISGLAIGIGALLFAGILSGQGDSPWPGLVAGAACAAISQAAIGPLLARTRKRLPDRPARDALTLYVDVTALVLAGLTCLLHPFGYVVVAAMLWLLYGGRRRAGQKYAGLRILRR